MSNGKAINELFKLVDELKESNEALKKEVQALKGLFGRNAGNVDNIVAKAQAKVVAPKECLCANRVQRLSVRVLSLEGIIKRSSTIDNSCGDNK